MSAEQLPQEPPHPLSAKFREVALLGEGSFGRVYRAVDDGGRRVAIKILHASLQNDPRSVWAFALEFAHLARLDHAAFPRAIEEGRTPDGSYYYVMDLVLGPSLDAELPMPANCVRACLGDLAEALAHVHGRGWVHGNLKPQQILVTPDAKLHVLNVGHLTPIGRLRETTPGAFAYMAPEVIGNQSLEPAADLYALGACGYQLWTGKPPFGGQPGALLRSQLLDSPAPIGPRTRDADPVLESMLLGLLAKDPAQRPDLASVLEILGRPLPPHLKIARPTIPSKRRFVGRREVLAAWEQELASCQRGNMLAIEGASGLGKTRLLEAAQLTAHTGGRLFVSAKFSQGATAGAAARSIVAKTLQAAARKPTDSTAAWLQCLIPRPLQDLEPQARYVAMLDEVLASLGAAARKLGGLAIGLDDWHLADAYSLEFVRRAARLSVDTPITWLITYESLPQPSPIWTLTAELTSQRFVLKPLDALETSELVSARLGGAVRAEVLAQLTEASQGNPRQLIGLLELLLPRASRLPGAGSLATAEPNMQVPLPQTQKTLWQALLLKLGPDAQQVARAASLSSGTGPLPLPVLALASGLTAQAFENAVAEMVSVELVVVVSGLLEWVHPNFAAICREGLTIAQLSEWASQMGIATLGVGVPTDSQTLSAVQLTSAAQLAKCSSDRAWASSLALAAGQRLLTMGAPAEALHFLEDAFVELGAKGATAEHLTCLLELGDAQQQIQRAPAAKSSYAQALALAAQLGDGIAGARANIGLANCLEAEGDLLAALVHFDAGETLASEVEAGALRTRAAISAARVLARIGNNAQALQRCEQAVSWARASESSALRARALTLQGRLLVRTDIGRAKEAMGLLEEALALCRALGDRCGENEALENLGDAFFMLGDLVAAADAFRRNVEVSRSAYLPNEALMAELKGAAVASERGSCENALAIATDIVNRTQSSESWPKRAFACAVAGQASWRAGRPVEGRKWLEDALELALASGCGQLEARVRILRLDAWLGSGELAAANSEHLKVQSLVETSGRSDAQADLGSLLAELARQNGQVERALELASGWANSPNRVASHRARQVAARAAAALGREHEAMAHARVANGIAHDWGAGWHIAADRLLLARLHAERGDLVAARETASAILERQDCLENLYARAGVALLLAGEGESHAVLAVEAALEALRPGLTALGRERAGWLLTAQGLGALVDQLDRRQIIGSHRQIDPTDLAKAAREMSLAESEAGIENCLLAAAKSMFKATRVTFTRDERNGQYQFTPGSLGEAETPGTETTSVVALPVATGRCSLGVLYLEREALAPEPSVSDRALLETLATMAASAIVRERAKHVLLQEARHLRENACLEATLLDLPSGPTASRSRLI